MRIVQVSCVTQFVVCHPKSASDLFRVDEAKSNQTKRSRHLEVYVHYVECASGASAPACSSKLEPEEREKHPASPRSL